MFQVLHTVSRLHTFHKQTFHKHTFHVHTFHVHTFHVHTFHVHTFHVHSFHVRTFHVHTFHVHSFHVHTFHVHSEEQSSVVCIIKLQRSVHDRKCIHSSSARISLMPPCNEQKMQLSTIIFFSAFYSLQDTCMRDLNLPL